MDPETVTLDVVIRRSEKYACTACGRRVSWRAVRVGILVLMCVTLVAVVVAKGIRTNQSMWGVLADLALVALGLATPSW